MKRKKRSAAALLRARNKELRECRAALDRALEVPTYSMRFLVPVIEAARAHQCEQGAILRFEVQEPMTRGPILKVDRPRWIQLRMDL